MRLIVCAYETDISFVVVFFLSFGGVDNAHVNQLFWCSRAKDMVRSLGKVVEPRYISTDCDSLIFLDKPLEVLMTLLMANLTRLTSPVGSCRVDKVCLSSFSNINSPSLTVVQVARFVVTVQSACLVIRN